MRRRAGDRRANARRAGRRSRAARRCSSTSAARSRRRSTRFRAAMPREVALHYAVKANPYAPVLALMARLVDGFDIASAASWDALRRGSGCRSASPDRASATGARSGDPRRRDAQPRKRRRGAARAGDRRAARLPPAAGDPGQPAFRAEGLGDEDGRRAKPFGIDHDARPALARGSSRPAPSGAACTSSPAARRSTPRRSIEAQAATCRAGGRAGRGRSAHCAASSSTWAAGSAFRTSPATAARCRAGRQRARTSACGAAARACENRVRHRARPLAGRARRASI